MGQSVGDKCPDRSKTTHLMKTRRAEPWLLQLTLLFNLVEFCSVFNPVMSVIVWQHVTFEQICHGLCCHRRASVRLCCSVFFSMAYVVCCFFFDLCRGYMGNKNFNLRQCPSELILPEIISEAYRSS